jgi:hypothetical protein
MELDVAEAGGGDQVAELLGDWRWSADTDASEKQNGHAA